MIQPEIAPTLTWLTGIRKGFGDAFWALSGTHILVRNKIADSDSARASREVSVGSTSSRWQVFSLHKHSGASLADTAIFGLPGYFLKGIERGYWGDTSLRYRQRSFSYECVDHLLSFNKGLKLRKRRRWRSGKS